MRSQFVIASLTLLATTACTSTNLNHALGTPKNPNPPFLDPQAKSLASAELWLLREKFVVLSQSSERPAANDIPNEQMYAYISAGYAVSDFYCGKFFDKTDEAYRRRSFGRAATNDVGTVVQAVLGLANAGKALITSIGTATGLADSIWRHYDAAFLISADLGNVEGLVDAAKLNLRTRTLGKDATLPTDWSTAQSAIMQYAKQCSFIGMQRLLNKSATERTQELNKDTEQRNGAPQTQTTTTTKTIPAAAPISSSRLPPGSAEPAVTPTRGNR